MFLIVEYISGIEHAANPEQLSLSFNRETNRLPFAASLSLLPGRFLQTAVKEQRVKRTLRLPLAILRFLETSALFLPHSANVIVVKFLWLLFLLLT